MENQLSCLQLTTGLSQNHIWYSFPCWRITCELYLKGQKTVCLCHVSVSVLNIISDRCVFDSTNQSKRSKWFKDCSCESFWENDILQAVHEPINKKWYIPGGHTSITCPSNGMELPGNNFPLIGNNHNLSYIISPVHQGLYTRDQIVMENDCRVARVKNRALERQKKN